MCLVLDNMKLVYHIARRYPFYARLPFEDRVQEGFVGLVRAANTYEEGDVPFSSYAGKHIEWAINNALRNVYPLKLSHNIREVVNTIKRKDLKDVPVPDIMTITGHDEETVKLAVSFIDGEFLSLDFEMSADGKDADTAFYNFIQIDEDFETNLLYQRCMNAVPEQYREPFKLLIEGYTHKEIADMLDLPLKKVTTCIKSARNNVRARKEQLIGI